MKFKASIIQFETQSINHSIEVIRAPDAKKSALTF